MAKLKVLIAKQIPLLEAGLEVSDTDGLAGEGGGSCQPVRVTTAVLN